MSCDNYFIMKSRKREWVDVLPGDLPKSVNALIGDLIFAIIAGLTIAYVVALYIRAAR